MKTLKIPVSGMHCRACEMLLEKSIGKVKGVAKVTADQSKGLVTLEYADLPPDITKIEKIILENDYLLETKQKLPWFSSNIDNYIEIFAIAVLLFIVYILLSASGMLSMDSMGAVNSPTLWVAFLVGLTAGVSSCMALVGGLILGVSAKMNQSQKVSSGWSRFTPHLYFNVGRVLGFAVLGGLLGLFGAFVSLSTLFLGLLTILVGGVMLLLGIQLSGLSPRLANISITLPKFLGKNIGTSLQSTKIGAMTTGALTFFLPCGFTLAMQVYAMSTGSFVAGALTLGFFALGTAPGLIGIGGLTAWIKGRFAKYFFHLTGVVVLALGIFNISNGYTLFFLGSAPTVKSEVVDPTTLPTQEIRMLQDDSWYSPKEVRIKPNHKIRIVFEAKNPYSCSSQFISPQVKVSAQLKLGENIIEFVSPASWEIPFSCSMGMYRGKFVVDTENSPAANVRE